MKMQMPGDQSDDRNEALEAPARLVAALRQVPGEKIFVPRTTDEAVLRAARTHLSRARKPVFTWWRLAPWAAGAAVAILLLFLSLNAPRPASSFAREDVNHDGTVDILDAFALAKKLEVGTSADGGIDLNGDGKVDQQDVATLAAQAVSLEKGGHS
jgi:hypothetical protein